MVRELLGRYGVRRTAPAFYQMMARLERDGLIDGWYGQVVVGDQAVTERRYRITKAGATPLGGDPPVLCPGGGDAAAEMVE